MMRSKLTVLEDRDNFTPAHAKMVGRFSSVLGQLSLDKLALLVGQPLGVLGEIGHREEKNKGGHAGNAAFNDENPSPAIVAPITLHLGNSVCQNTTKGTGQSSRAEEEAEALLGFAALVPHS